MHHHVSCWKSSSHGPGDQYRPEGTRWWMLHVCMTTHVCMVTRPCDHSPSTCDSAPVDALQWTTPWHATNYLLCIVKSRLTDYQIHLICETVYWSKHGGHWLQSLWFNLEDVVQRATPTDWWWQGQEWGERERHFYEGCFVMRCLLLLYGGVCGCGVWMAVPPLTTSFPASFHKIPVSMCKSGHTGTW